MLSHHLTLITALKLQGLSESAGGVLALLVQQVEQRCGFLADEVEAAAVVDVFDVVPGDALCPILLLQNNKKKLACPETIICKKRHLHFHCCLHDP